MLRTENVLFVKKEGRTQDRRRVGRSSNPLRLNTNTSFEPSGNDGDPVDPLLSFLTMMDGSKETRDNRLPRPSKDPSLYGVLFSSTFRLLKASVTPHPSTIYRTD